MFNLGRSLIALLYQRKLPLDVNLTLTEIHPILMLEYCPKNKTCKKDSDENWIDLDAAP